MDLNLLCVCQGNKKILKQIFGGRNNGKQPFIDILTFSAKKKCFFIWPPHATKLPNNRVVSA
jgi:hypothetical protein